MIIIYCGCWKNDNVYRQIRYIPQKRDTGDVCKRANQVKPSYIRAEMIRRRPSAQINRIWERTVKGFILKNPTIQRYLSAL